MNSPLSPRGNKAAVFITAVFVTLFTALSATSCAQAPEAAQSEGEPAAIAEVPGTNLHRLTLTEHAVERVGIETAVVAADPHTGKLTVPYGAILYDSSGKAWVYTNPEPRVYVRHAITVQRINGDVAVLTAGPPAGTVVVTTGAEELLGTEFDTAE